MFRVEKMDEWISKDDDQNNTSFRRQVILRIFWKTHEGKSHAIRYFYNLAGIVAFVSKKMIKFIGMTYTLACRCSDPVAFLRQLALLKRILILPLGQRDLYMHLQTPLN